MKRILLLILLLVPTLGPADDVEHLKDYPHPIKCYPLIERENDDRNARPVHSKAVSGCSGRCSERDGGTSLLLMPAINPGTN